MTIQAIDTLDTVDAKLAQLQERRDALTRQQQGKSAEANALRGQLSALLENFESADDVDAERARLSARISALGVEEQAIVPVLGKLDLEMATLSRQQQVLAAERAADVHEQAIADARAACLPIHAAVRTFVSETLPPLVAALHERRGALVQAARASRQAAELAGVTPRHTLDTVNLTEALPLNVGSALRFLLEVAEDYRRQADYSERIKADRAVAAA